jgi:hypothetical protein
MKKQEKSKEKRLKDILFVVTLAVTILLLLGFLFYNRMNLQITIQGSKFFSIFADTSGVVDDPNKKALKNPKKNKNKGKDEPDNADDYHFVSSSDTDNEKADNKKKYNINVYIIIGSMTFFIHEITEKELLATVFIRSTEDIPEQGEELGYTWYTAAIKLNVDGEVDPIKFHKILPREKLDFIMGLLSNWVNYGKEFDNMWTRNKQDQKVFKPDLLKRKNFSVEVMLAKETVPRHGLEEVPPRSKPLTRLIDKVNNRNLVDKLWNYYRYDLYDVNYHIHQGDAEEVNKIRVGKRDILYSLMTENEAEYKLRVHDFVNYLDPPKIKLLKKKKGKLDKNAKKNSAKTNKPTDQKKSRPQAPKSE